jgi:glycosyltransferase involved in cell wall biosynthesis
MKKNKIVWALIGDEKVASSRIHGLNIHKKLLENNYLSLLWYELSGVSTSIPISKNQFPALKFLFNVGDIFIIQKIKQDNGLIQLLKNIGVKVYFIDCDLPIARDIGNQVDKVIVPSTFFKKIYDSAIDTDVVCINDAPEVFIEAIINNKAKTAYKCVWFGTKGGKRWEEVQHLQALIDNTPKLKHWTLTTISNHPSADYKWDENSYNFISTFDAVLIPVFDREDTSYVKSSNRVLQSMALGVPVIASFIPSYKEIIQNSVNGYICDSDSDWVDALLALEAPEVKNNIVKNGYQIAQNGNVNNIMKQWEVALGLTDCFKGEDENFARISNELRFLAYRNLLRKHFFYQRDYISAASLGQKIEALSVVGMLIFKKVMRKLLSFR